MDATDTPTYAAERALVAALLFSGEPAREILDSTPCSDFASPGLGALWTWAREQPEGALTPPAFAAKAAALGHHEYTLAWCLRGYHETPTFAVWSETAAEVRRLAGLRRLAATAQALLADIATPGAEPESVADLYANALTDHARGGRSGGIRTVGELLPAVLEYIHRLHQGEGDVRGVPTGYDELDRVSPLRRGELTILAARTGIGKSAMAVNLACNMVRMTWGAGIISLEMTAEALARRVLQSEAEACIARVGKGGFDDYGRLQRTAERLVIMPLAIAQPPRLTVSGLRRLARQMVTQHRVSCLFVDYLQLVQPDVRMSNRNRENEVAEVSAAAKGIAMDCRVPVVMLAQLNRSAEGEKPRLSHLRDSGAIEQDADAVWMLDRDRKDGTGKTSLTIAKNRDGEGGIVIPLRFEAAHTRFYPAGGAAYKGGRQAEAAEVAGEPAEQPAF